MPVHWSYSAAVKVSLISSDTVDNCTIKVPREVILHLYSALVGPHLESCIELRGPQHKKNMELLRRAMKITQGLELLWHRERLTELRLFSTCWKNFSSHFSEDPTPSPLTLGHSG